ncbi:hypothetical protein VTO42DRAFT_3481 [Malbranchea cinnamomea]
MSGAELGLAIAGTTTTVELCFKYGKILLEKYKAFRAAEALIQEAITCVEYHLQTTTWQLNLIRRVWDSLDEEHRYLQDQILRILLSKLEAAVLDISRVEKTYSDTSNSPRKLPTGWKKVKYAFSVKECLDKTLKELEAWQKKFDPLWYLLTRVAASAVDRELARREADRPKPFATVSHLRLMLREEPRIKVSIFLPQEGLATAQRHSIPFSTCQLLERPGSSTLILESAACDSDASDISAFTKDVRNLAGKLKNVEPTVFNLLECAGVVKVRNSATQKPQSFDFLFKFPKHMQHPQSLRKILLSGNEDHSLTARFRLAKQLATSVCYVHTLGYVHKNIRPETVLIFDDGESSLGSLFLVGFTTFRMADVKTLRRGDLAREKNIYRHPDRQGLHPDADYIMQHDIYSLGVCLLEIGLWESFVISDMEDKQSLQQKTRIRPYLTERGSIKSTLTALASDVLPKKMGDKYSQVVVNCLTCLDEDNPDFGDESEFQDEDGVLIAVKYIQKILLQLESISI